jgi:AraC-like DNA-binding protein
MKMLSAAEIENAAFRRAEPAAIWKTRKYIEQNSGEKLSLTHVANVVNMNANHLSENFKQVTGTNFVEYVARTRFANTCDLLRNPKLRISEIAFAAGFQSLSQFNRIFKRFSGKSPTQYRAAVCDGRTGKILRVEQENARRNA